MGNADVLSIRQPLKQNGNGNVVLHVSIYTGVWSYITGVSMHGNGGWMLNKIEAFVDSIGSQGANLKD